MIYNDDLIKAALFNFVSLFFDHSAPGYKYSTDIIWNYEVVNARCVSNIFLVTVAYLHI